MSNREFLSVCLFIIFWWLIYSLEVKYIISWIKQKTFTKSKLASIIHVLAIAGIVCLAHSYFIEPYWIDVRHVHIHSNKLINTSLTIVQISDLHCDKKIRNENELIQIINAIKPDVIVFTGDAINTHEALPTFKKTLASLQANLGKFAVRGNFDVWHPKNPNLFKDTGFKELDAELVSLKKKDARFSIMGIGVDNNFRDTSFLKRMNENDYNILLFHYPGINEELPDVPVDLFLSGHTHGGQISLPFYGALVTLSKYGKKYESGRYNIGQRILYVNRGIGMEGGFAPRIRFWARPEITVFHIEPKEEIQLNPNSKNTKNSSADNLLLD